MSFLSNKAINLCNLNSALCAIGFNIFNLFGALYFFKQGVPLIIIFLLWSGILFLRLILRPLAFSFASRYGLKKSMALGVLFYASWAFVFPLAQGLNFWTAIFLLVSALGDVFYWLTFHAAFTTLGETKHRGKHFGARWALINVTTAITPFFTGILIDRLGFWAIFVLSGCAFLLSLWPLAKIKDQDLKLTRTKPLLATWSKSRQGFWIFFADGNGFHLHLFVWVFALFFLTGNFTLFGGLLALAIFLKFISSLLLGASVDDGYGGRIMRIGAVLTIFVILGRAFLVNTILAIILFDFLMGLAECFYLVPMNTASYNLSKNSGDPLAFHFFTESAWDLGGVLALIVGAGFIWLGIDIRLIMPLSIISVLLVAKITGDYLGTAGQKMLADKLKS